MISHSKILFIEKNKDKRLKHVRDNRIFIPNGDYNLIEDMIVMLGEYEGNDKIKGTLLQSISEWIEEPQLYNNNEGFETNEIEDEINKPKHYNNSDIEPITVIEDWDLSPHLANVVKYIYRHKLKGTPMKDLKKAEWYINRYIKLLEGDKK